MIILIIIGAILVIGLIVIRILCADTIAIRRASKALLFTGASILRHSRFRMDFSNPLKYRKY